MQQQFTVTHAIGDRVVGHVLAGDAEHARTMVASVSGYGVAALKARATQDGER